jgi:hypothetical protein
MIQIILFIGFDSVREEIVQRSKLLVLMVC